MLVHVHPADGDRDDRSRELADQLDPGVEVEAVVQRADERDQRGGPRIPG